MSKLKSVDIDKSKLKKIMDEQAITQQELADVIHYSQQYISKSKWGIDMFSRVCSVLDITPDEILLYPLQDILKEEDNYKFLTKQMEYERHECYKNNGIDEQFINYIIAMGYNVSECHGTTHSRNSIIKEIKFEKGNDITILSLQKYLNLQNTIKQNIKDTLSQK